MGSLFRAPKAPQITLPGPTPEPDAPPADAARAPNADALSSVRRDAARRRKNRASLRIPLGASTANGTGGGLQVT